MLRRLLDAFGDDPAAVLGASRSRLQGVRGIGAHAAEAIASWRERFDPEREETMMERHHARFLIQDDAAYPALLRETYDPPIGLYWRGDYTVDRPCVAIVGTRRATLYGFSAARKLAAELARLGFCIVSGMARGTDTAAHEGALEAGGKTVAVFGCGMDIVYPPENLELYRRIAESGAVCSEFPFGRRADRQTFPMRNRVVAGMSEGVIVVETDVNGGSMITARFAGEQGRQVFAVPGRIDQATSRGSHQLIRDGATLVTSADDVLEELRYARPGFGEKDGVASADGDEASRGGRADFEPEEREIVEVFRGGEAWSIDGLAESTGRTAPELSSLLMALELKGAVARRTDGRYEPR